MPDSVPEGVTRAFSALVPGMILFTCAAVVYGIFHYVGATTLPECIFKVIQTPLQGLSDTLGGGVVIVGLQSVLFWAGIHGPNVVGGVVGPLLIANSLDNQHLLDMGMTLVNNPSAKIITHRWPYHGEVETAQVHDEDVLCAGPVQYQRADHLRSADCLQSVFARAVHHRAAHRAFRDVFRHLFGLYGSVQRGAGALDDAAHHRGLPARWLAGRGRADREPRVGHGYLLSVPAGAGSLLVEEQEAEAAEQAESAALEAEESTEDPATVATTDAEAAEPAEPAPVAGK